MTSAADHFQFDCVHNGQWFKLASGATHRAKNVGVPGSPAPDSFIIVDRLYRLQTVPKSSVHIRNNAPLP